MVEAVVVLSGQEQLFLFFSQVFIWVQIGLTQDVHIALKLSDLVQVSDESLGDLLYKQRLIGNIELNKGLLLFPLVFKATHVRFSSSNRLSFASLEICCSTH